MSSLFAQLPDVRLHYDLQGETSRPVLVLSNSLGTNLRMWEPQIRQLAIRYRIVRYDTRGHGRSSVAPGPYTIAQLGNDVILLMDHLQVDRFSFCGLSMGGLTGMWLALEHADRIDKLVLANTAAYIGPPDNWTSRVQIVRQGGIEAIADKVLSVWLTPGFAKARLELADSLRKMLVATPAEGYAASCQAIRDADLRARIGRIKAPTLVISGRADPATPPSDGRFLAEAITGAEFVELDAAHLSNLEQEEKFSATVMDFLSRSG